MRNFKPSKVTLALVSSGLIALSTSSFAAQAADGDKKAKEKEIEVINVTGMRGSLALSQAIKMSSSSVVEAVSAEDIGKLPDASIAESIARLPGITAQRLDGRANVISIRGLAPDFTTATLNGREQVTVGDNRGVEFDQYPSELLSGVIVYKTPDASLMAQAIGGTVDMQTIRPLTHGKRDIAISARFEKNDLGALNAGSTDTGHRFSVSYIDQFADDTIGVAIGIASMSSPNQEERWNSWGYPNHNYDNEAPLILGGAKPYVRSSELERTGIMGVLEYQPNDKIHTIVDAYYSDFKDTQILRGIEIPGQWGTGWAADSIDAYEWSDGLVTSGQINGVRGQIRNDLNIRDSEIISLGVNTKYVLDDKWTLVADLSYSKAERTDFGMESYSGSGRGNGVGVADDIAFEMAGDGGALFSPQLDYSDTDIFKLGGALSWGNSVVNSDGQDGFINTPSIDDELSAIRLSAEYTIDSDIISSVEFGVNYSERQKSKIDTGIYLRLKDYPNMVDVPSEYLLSPTSLEFIGMGNMLSYDTYGLYKSGIYNEFSQGQTDLGRVKGSWDITEKVSILYAQANVDTELFDIPVSGNFGVQIVGSDQSSLGNRASLNEEGNVVVTQFTAGKKYTEVLPSLNLSFEIADEQKIRIGVARTLARTRMDKMNANISFSYDPGKAGSNDLNQSPWSGEAGNPELRPWLAKQYDISYENYLSDAGYFSVAGFYKDLETYVYEQSIAIDFSGVQVAGPDPVLHQGLFSGPANGDGGKIHGIEATLSLNGSIVDEKYAGFGVIISGGITDSEVRESADSDPIDLPGLSKKVLNATVYYENGGFQSRISSRYRSDFLGEISGLSLSRELHFVKAELVIDAQIGFDFSESDFKSLDGLSVQFQVNNLTDEPFTTFSHSDSRQVRDFQRYGRNFMLGMNYKF
ncbi:MAG: TonB-dependent receptor [Alteromonadaceae bacterium]|nr:TonB-dependent receptor [Alteromonadaceae bacterium]